MNRRNFIGTLTAGVAALLAPALAFASPKEHDDTARLQAMIDSGQQIPPGEYRLSEPLRLHGNVVVLKDCVFRKREPGFLVIDGVSESVEISNNEFIVDPTWKQRLLMWPARRVQGCVIRIGNYAPGIVRSVNR